MLTAARFRWVQCQMDFLAAQRTGKAVKKALEQLPDDINSVYTRILNSILPADQNMARQAFMWLSFSKRPLSLLELCEGVVVDEEDSTIDEDSRLHPYSVILRVCKGLIVYDEKLGEVALAHSSVKAFLISAKIKETEASFFSFDRQEATRMILRKCLTYLMFHNFDVGCHNREHLSDRFENFHLLNYAAFCWAMHAGQGGYLIDEEDHSLISRFLSTYDSPHGGNFTHWVLCLIEDVDEHTIRATEPLYYMCSFGLISVVEGLIKNHPKLNIDAPGGRMFSTPLQVTCTRGPIDIIHLLLERGANPNSRNIDQRSCLFWAVRYQRQDVYQLLRQYGADPNEDAEFWVLANRLSKHKSLRTLTMLRDSYESKASSAGNQKQSWSQEEENMTKRVTWPFSSNENASQSSVETRSSEADVPMN